MHFIISPEVTDIIVSGIQCLSFFLVLQILSEKAFSIKEGLLIVVPLAIIASFLFSYVSYFVNLLIVFIFVVSLVFKKKSISYSIALTLIMFVYSIVGDYTVSILFIEILGLEKLFNNSFYQIEHSLLQLIVAIFLTFFLHKFKRKIKVYSFIEQKKYGIIVSFVLLITLIVFYANIYRGSIAGFDRKSLQFNTFLFLIYFVILLGILYMITRTAIRELNMKNQKEQFEQLKEYTHALEALHREMRLFRHDYVNMLSTLSGYMEENDMEGLKRHFVNNILSMNRKIENNNYKISLLQNICITELKGLMGIKLVRAQELKINTTVEVMEEIHEINMNNMDLCRAVGILLDNAIEAALASKNPAIRLAVIKKEASILIVLANSIPVNMPPIYQIFQEGFSTKGKGRGLGLASLREMLRNYQNVFLDTKITEVEFIQELEIS